MKLMYIASLDFYTKPNPSYHLMTTMLEDVLNSGIEVLLLGCAEEGITEHIPDFLNKHPLFKHHLVPCPKVEKSDFVRRYLNGIRYSRCIGKMIKRYVKECDMIFVQSSPTVLYTLHYARKYAGNKKVIYNVQDMFPGSSIASGVMPQKWMQAIFYRLQKIAYKKSDIITAISEDMKDKLIEQGVPSEKIKVIVNWFDDSSVHEVPWSDNRFVKKYNMSPEKFYVQYAGTMGYVFDYQMVINVAQKLKGHRDIMFQMIGEGSQKEAFIQAVKNKGLDNIVFLPLEPQEMVSDVYSACSVCFIPLKKGIIGNSVPSKAGLLMACKRAIITSVDKGSHYYNMVNKYAGVAVANDEPDNIVKAILNMKESRDMCIKYGISGYKYGHELYSRSNNMKKYLGLFNECVVATKQNSCK
ncbi:MAG: glycosyltransferase family 4 protein [Oscillospiraceae bacterium]|nr:glycosyltransferase family 4 protein [Oscillospiraceae bacterium]